MEKNEIDIPEHIFEDLWIGIHHLPAQEGYIPGILKGHLCLEVLLKKFVTNHFSSPAEFSNGRFTFYQTLCLARCLDKGKRNEWIWTAIGMLNSLRNEIAHNIESCSELSKETKIKADELMDYVEMNQIYQTTEENRKHYNRLDLALRTIFVALFSLVHNDKEK